MHDLNDLAIFAKVVQAGSLTAAADVLGIPKSNVSRRLSRLEEALGVRLLERTTRKLHLTEVGALYYQHCLRILEELEHAELSVQQRLDSPRGLLRVSASHSVGRGLLAPVLGNFLALYPDVQVHMELTNRRVDLIEEGFDLVLRIGKLEESNLVARYLGSAHMICCATPEYLKQAPALIQPQDLLNHSCLTMADMPQADRWTFSGVGGDVTVNVSTRASVNDFDTLREMSLAHAGIYIAPAYSCTENIASGRLAEVLQGWHLPSTAIHAVYPSHRGATPKLRALIDFLVENLQPILNSAPCVKVS